ncbi:unnamed protein product [Durusdinium trenchii]|uniref:Uncharacterized protein n=1 Tax=Durusdinium trenchii TaxID=1381693 RepID=A0ABP0ISI9_9DINO
MDSPELRPTIRFGSVLLDIFRPTRARCNGLWSKFLTRDARLAQCLEVHASMPRTSLQVLDEQMAMETLRRIRPKSQVSTGTTSTNTSERLWSALPCQVVDGADAVDLSEEQVGFQSSYKCTRTPSWVPRGIPVPLPPNRIMHERHVLKLGNYLKDLDHQPASLSEQVEEKRDEHAMRLELQASENDDSYDPLCSSMLS